MSRGCFATYRGTMAEAKFKLEIDTAALEERLAENDCVHVVRCKDCKHRDEDPIFNSLWCRGRRVDPDFYCADGERG